GHIIQSIAIGFEGAYRGSKVIAVLFLVFVGKTTLPVIGVDFISAIEFIAPWIYRFGKPTHGSPLPFCFSREPFSCPFRIGFGIFPGNMGYGVIFFTFDIASRSEGLPPIGPRRPFPPVARVVEWHRTFCRSEDQRPCAQ